MTHYLDVQQVIAEHSPQMFSYSQGFTITGGAFYNVAGNVNIHADNAKRKIHCVLYSRGS